MSISQITFLGATVKGVNSNIGWNSESSRLTVNLVEDSSNGDSFSPGDIGGPVYFTLGSYTFNGLLKKYFKENSTTGSPQYTVECQSPVNLLSNSKLIIGDYVGSVNSIPNLINIYGYWENTFGFGTAQLNDVGMPWGRIKDGVHVITQLPAIGTYGGPLKYHNVNYSVDLMELPTLPSSFRIAGPVISILDFIDECCHYAGYDYFIEMVGTIIYVRTVNRQVAAPLGTIDTVVSNAMNTGSFSGGTNGLEERDEITTAFLIGGPVHTLYKSTSIATFWGYDVNLNPILGNDRYLHFYNSEGRYVGSERTVTMNLKADGDVASILGSTSYPCSTFEMRIALMGMEAWQNWISRFRPDIGNLLDLVVSDSPSEILRGKLELPNDRVDDTPNNVANLARIAAGADNYGTQGGGFRKSSVVYELVRYYANNYMGKKYACRLPFVVRAVDVDTNAVYYSYDIADAGYVDETNYTIFGETITQNDLDGLPTAFRDLFQAQDTRYLPFTYHSDVTRADHGRINKVNTLINGNALYSKGQLDSKIIFIPEPAVVITIDPVFETIDRNSSSSFGLPQNFFGGNSVVQSDSPVPPANSVLVGTFYLPKTITATIDCKGKYYRRFGNLRGTLQHTADTTWEGFFVVFDTNAHSFGEFITIRLEFPADGIENGVITVTDSTNFLNEYLFPLGQPLPVENPLSLTYFHSTDSIKNDSYGITLSAAAINNPSRHVGSIAPSVHPNHIDITSAHIPLRSNVLTYGPWYYGTIPGNVLVESDPSYVPWVFGGFTNLNTAAAARVSTSVTAMQVAESATINLAGTPAFNLGDVMETGGPNITRVNVNWNERGVTTSYGFETFVPRFGQMGKALADRIKRNADLTRSAMKDARVRLRQSLIRQDTLTRAAEGSAGNYLTQLARWLRRQSPHNVFITRNALDSTNIVRPIIATATLTEAIASLNADNSQEFLQGSVVDWSALIRPISIFGTGHYMAQMSFPTGIWNNSSIPTSATLNPVKVHADGQDFDILSYGYENYQGLKSYQNNIGATETRRNFVALRAPLILTGHGYDFNSQYLPASGTYTRSDNWLTGPLDPLWDANRKVWTVHGCKRGKSAAIIPAASANSYGSGYMNIYQGFTNTTTQLLVFNTYATAVPSGKWCIATYFPDENKMILTSADC